MQSRDKKSNEIQVPVRELKRGMYVSRLDRDWLDTPFMMQGFLLKTQEDVDIVASLCEFVFVDPDRKAKLSAQESYVGGSATQAFLASQAYEQDFETECELVKPAFERARSHVKDIFRGLRLSQEINVEQTQATVDHCVDSILKNPDALMWLSRIRAENEYTAEHSLNVCILAVAFGRHLGMSKTELKDLGVSALLHDVGKMRVPEEVLNKPAALTDRELSLMRSHTVHGRNLLMSTPRLYQGAIDVAYSHHERLDGKGYPRKIGADKINRFTRIVSIVDAFDAMTADRCYSKALSSTEALRIIYNLRGTQFDEDLVVSFIESVGLYPPGTIVELHNGLIGIVLRTHPEKRHLPDIRLLLDMNHDPLEVEDTLELSAMDAGELGKQYFVKTVHPSGAFGIDPRHINPLY